MEMQEFTGQLWMHINAAIRKRIMRGENRRDPDVILVSFDRLKEMHIAIGELSVYYDPKYGMLKYRGIRILPDPTKGNDDFEILYNELK
jgi:hypothetical protein